MATREITSEQYKQVVNLLGESLDLIRQAKAPNLTLAAKVKLLRAAAAKRDEAMAIGQ